MFALEKMKKLLNTICTKLVIEIQLITRKFPVWFSVEDIAYLQVQRGSNKKKKKKKKTAGKIFHKRLREMVKQPEDQFDEQGHYISFDPIRDGNCQFSSICRILSWKYSVGKKFHKRLRDMVKQPEDQFDEQCYDISFDPLCDGNCQFISICHILRIWFSALILSIKSKNSFISFGKST